MNNRQKHLTMGGKMLPGMVAIDKNVSSGIQPTEHLKNLLKFSKNDNNLENADYDGESKMEPKGVIMITVTEKEINGSVVGVGFEDRDLKFKLGSLKGHVSATKPGIFVIVVEEKCDQDKIYCVLVSYIPDALQPKERLLYSTSKGVIKAAIIEANETHQCIIEEYNVHEMKELSGEAYAKRLEIEKPFTEAEKQRMEEDQMETAGGYSFLARLKELDSENSGETGVKFRDPKALPGFGLQVRPSQIYKNKDQQKLLEETEQGRKQRVKQFLSKYDDGQEKPDPYGKLQAQGSLQGTETMHEVDLDNNKEELAAESETKAAVLNETHEDEEFQDEESGPEEEMEHAEDIKPLESNDENLDARNTRPPVNIVKMTSGVFNKVKQEEKPYKNDDKDKATDDVKHVAHVKIPEAYKGTPQSTTKITKVPSQNSSKLTKLTTSGTKSPYKNAGSLNSNMTNSAKSTAKVPQVTISTSMTKLPPKKQVSNKSEKESNVVKGEKVKKSKSVPKNGITAAKGTFEKSSEPTHDNVEKMKHNFQKKNVVVHVTPAKKDEECRVAVNVGEDMPSRIMRFQKKPTATKSANSSTKVSRVVVKPNV